jgi:hypothetical protein
MIDRRQQIEFRAIDETESEDFNRVVKEQEYHRDDFELAEEVDEARLAAFEDLVIMIAKVTVTQKKTGASRSYPAGDDGTAWVIEFERDLQAGVFR